MTHEYRLALSPMVEFCLVVDGRKANLNGEPVTLEQLGEIAHAVHRARVVMQTREAK